MALSPYDQQVYDAGFKYIPQSQYLLNPFQIPQGEEAQGNVAPGLPAIYQAQGGDGFNPYNMDMSKIRQDYNAFPSRQAAEIYSKTFNPQSTFDPNLVKAQNLYNLSSSALAGGPSTMKLGNNVISLKDYTPDQLEFLKTANADFIDDARMQYATQGQYVDPYDPNYSSMTEAQKFMDNYPDYYGVPSGVPEPGIPGAIKSYMQNSLLGKGFGIAKDFLDNVLPINERAIMENEARGAGIFTDDIGRIVTDDYNTAGGIMAGYNLNKIDAGTFDKRRDTIENTLGSKYGLSASQIEAAKNDPNYTGPGKNLIDRLGLLDESEEDILGARKKTQQIYKMRTDKKAADKAEKQAEAEAEAAQQAEIVRRSKDSDNDGVPDYVEDAGGSAPDGMYGTDYQGSSSPSSVGGGSGNPYGGGPGGVQSGMSSSSSPTNIGNPFGYMYGGRVYYMNGGLADLVDIYD